MKTTPHWTAPVHDLIRRPHWTRHAVPLTLGTIYRHGWRGHGWRGHGWRVVASKPGWVLLAPVNFNTQK